MKITFVRTDSRATEARIGAGRKLAAESRFARGDHHLRQSSGHAGGVDGGANPPLRNGAPSGFFNLSPGRGAESRPKSVRRDVLSWKPPGTSPP